MNTDDIEAKKRALIRRAERPRNDINPGESDISECTCYDIGANCSAPDHDIQIWRNRAIRAKWEQTMSDEPMALAMAEIAGIASQRGIDKAMFSMADYYRLGAIEKIARRSLEAQQP